MPTGRTLQRAALQQRGFFGDLGSSLLGGLQSAGSALLSGVGTVFSTVAPPLLQGVGSVLGNLAQSAANSIFGGTIGRPQPGVGQFPAGSIPLQSGFGQLLEFPTPAPRPPQPPVFSGVNFNQVQLPMPFPTAPPQPTLPAPSFPQFEVPPMAVLPGGLNIPGFNLQSPLVREPCAGSSPFRPTMATARATAFFLPNPITGALTWFKPAGKPILWQDDLRACKRVGRIAARARRAKR